MRCAGKSAIRRRAPNRKAYGSTHAYWPDTIRLRSKAVVLPPPSSPKDSQFCRPTTTPSCLPQASSKKHIKPRQNHASQAPRCNGGTYRSLCFALSRSSPKVLPQLARTPTAASGEVKGKRAWARLQPLSQRATVQMSVQNLHPVPAPPAVDEQMASCQSTPTSASACAFGRSRSCGMSHRTVYKYARTARGSMVMTAP